MINIEQKEVATPGIRTVQIVKNTWILEMPTEICRHEGLADGTIVSLTIKNHGIQAQFIRPPSKRLQEISRDLIAKNK